MPPEIDSITRYHLQEAHRAAANCAWQLAAAITHNCHIPELADTLRKPQEIAANLSDQLHHIRRLAAGLDPDLL